MTDADSARLRSNLDLVTYLAPKPGVSGASPGVVPLDFWSGLFLERGENDHEWTLEGRTWGHPPESLVDDWHARAALAAKELDPAVQIPTPPRSRRAPQPAGRAADKNWLGRLGRHTG
jgi:hypothetical protein